MASQSPSPNSHSSPQLPTNQTHKRSNSSLLLWSIGIIGVIFIILLVFPDRQNEFPTVIQQLQKPEYRHDIKTKNHYKRQEMKKLTTTIFKPQWVSEGQGAKVIRVLGNQHIRRLDPFLMLDYFHVKLPGGFPDHPHRGFETVTYMLEGEVAHEDFKGHKGVIGPGDIQWMTAGKGIVHSEMPTSFTVTSKGFQLWLNLKASNKMINPRYQELKAAEIPIVKKQNMSVKVIAGQWEGVKGPIKVETPAYYFDVHFHQPDHFELDIPKTWNAIIFVYEGELTYKDQQKEHLIKTDHCGRLSNGVTTQTFKGNKGKFIIVAGQPIGEPVEQYGPFVMTTRQQLSQTVRDYQQAKNGFEGANQWESEIKDMAYKK